MLSFLSPTVNSELIYLKKCHVYEYIPKAQVNVKVTDPKTNTSKIVRKKGLCFNYFYNNSKTQPLPVLSANDERTQKYLNLVLDRTPFTSFHHKVHQYKDQLLYYKNVYLINFESESEKRKDNISNYWRNKKTDYDSSLLNESYNLKHKENFITKTKEVFKESNIKAPQKMLELASGSGRLTSFMIAFLEEKGFSPIIDALEPSQSLVDGFKSKEFPFIRNVYVTTAEEFDCGEERYDIIYGCWILENILDYDIPRVLLKLKNCLKDDGYFLLNENVNQVQEMYFLTKLNQKIRPFSSYDMFFSLTGLERVYMSDYSFLPKNYSGFRYIGLQKEKNY